MSFSIIGNYTISWILRFEQIPDNLFVPSCHCGVARRPEFLVGLDDYRFLVFAEGTPECVGDFADGGVGFDGLEDGGH